MSNNPQELLTLLNGPSQMVGLLESRLSTYEGRISKLGEDKTLLLKAQILLDQAIGRVSEGGIKKIEQVVTDGLKLVFPDMDLQFLIEKTSGARGTSHKMLIRSGKIVGPIADTFGGGVVNVTQFLLRVIMIQRFGLKKFMALDETFNNVSDCYLGNVSSLIRSLCEDQEFQVLLVTHQKKLASAANRVYMGVAYSEADTIEPRLVQIDPQEFDDEDQRRDS